MLVPDGVELLEAGALGLGERRRLGGKPHQPLDKVVAGVRIECRLDPGKPLFGGKRLGLFFHPRLGETLEKGNIDPGLAVIVVE